MVATTTSATALGTRQGASHLGPFAMRWREQGDPQGRVTLLLHGIYAGASGYEWRRLAPVLAGRVRTPDLLGTGISDRPDLEWTAEVVTAVVDALIRDAATEAGPPVVVASSLTGAHAVRAVAEGAEVERLVLITPTGLGRAQASTSGTAGRIVYAIGRHTPIGDAVVHLLSSGPSVRWFQTNQTYADPEVLTEEEVVETRRVARLTNAKHLQLAFVADRIGLAVEPEEVRLVAPTVVWGSGQGFVEADEPDRWRAAGAEVHVMAEGLPQVEAPERVRTIVSSA
jgi:pimeloyl-ACP methyl ester carboxylesterase